MTTQEKTAHLTGAAAWQALYLQVRRRSAMLAEPLSVEDCCVQSMPDASPVKWHLAHTTWFFETFILERQEPGFRYHHPQFRSLFNSYYNGIGQKHPRAQRGMLTRPSLDDVWAYRNDVDARMMRCLENGTDELCALVELGLQHEQQHQELMLTDIKHLLSLNPLNPAYLARLDVSEAKAAAFNEAVDWQIFDAGVVDIGHAGNDFCFDNELPRHRQFVERFALASRLVTNGEFLAFVQAGGYSNPLLWLSEGWDWLAVQKNTGGASSPLYWRQSAKGGWQEFTLHGLHALDLAQPVTHLSYFEADAYARWADARLPTEAEWESAAQSAVSDKGIVSLNRIHPPVLPADAVPGLQQLFGTCWQWTSSAYSPYPGYAAPEGALGEYNGKFMVNQYVLRGSSCVTPDGHARSSYRNFFPASARWQFSGLRLAKALC